MHESSCTSPPANHPHCQAQRTSIAKHLIVGNADKKDQIVLQGNSRIRIPRDIQNRRYDGQSFAIQAYTPSHHFVQPAKVQSY